MNTPTLKITVMPLIGNIDQNERLNSLRGCHAIHERKVVRRNVLTQFMGTQINEAVRELLLADRVRSLLDSKMQFIVQVEAE